ncbi:MAG TPA: hypothetical protein VGK29_18065 [Paludibaculum sp.]|jgi:hypothetical protein
MSVAFGEKEIRAPEFEAGLDGTYFIFLELPGDRASDRLAAAWEAFEGNNCIASGTTGHPSAGSYESARVFTRAIGSFRVSRGHRYTVRLNLAQDSTELIQANAQLVIGTHPNAKKDETVRRMLDAVIAKAVAILGLLTLLVPPLITGGRRLRTRLSLHGKPPSSV